MAFCELIRKGFLTFKVYYSSSRRYLRKLKTLYFQRIITPFLLQEMKHELALVKEVSKYFHEFNSVLVTVKDYFCSLWGGEDVGFKKDTLGQLKYSEPLASLSVPYF